MLSPSSGMWRLTASDAAMCWLFWSRFWAVRPETARRVRQRIRTILRWCEAHDYCTGNAAGEALNGALPSMPRLKAHHRALPYPEVTEALETVDESGASLAAKLCFSLPCIDGCALRRGTWRDLGRDRRGLSRVADSRRADEGRGPASCPVVRCSACGLGTSGAAPRRFRADLPVICEAGPTHVGHDADQSASVDRTCRARDCAWFPLDVQGLGGGMHKCATRSHGVELGACGWIFG